MKIQTACTNPTFHFLEIPEEAAASLCVCRAERSWAQGCEAPPGQALLCESPSPSPLAPVHAVTCLCPPTPPTPLPGFISALGPTIWIPPTPTLNRRHYSQPRPTSSLCPCVPSTWNASPCVFNGCASCKLSSVHTSRSLPGPGSWAGAPSRLPGHLC